MSDSQNQTNPNKNIVMLARLYDSTAADLHAALATKQVAFTDDRIKNKVQWLGDIARTLSLVYQIETMRAKPKEGDSVTLPEEKVVIDPVLQKAQQNLRGPGSGNLGQFPSPGGWTP